MLHSRRVARFSAAVLASATLLAAGGGQGADQQIRSVVNHFTVEVGQSHYSQACGLTTGQMKSVCGGLSASRGLAAECRGVSANSALGRACASSHGVPAALSTFTSLTISKVVISGSSATVAFNGSGEVMMLSKQNGKWLIASA